MKNQELKTMIDELLFFGNYLSARRYRQSTINGYIKNMEYFLEWATDNNLYEIENVSYNDLLSHVQYLQNKQLSVQTINIRLSSISKYFEFLKQENIVSRNPARTLRIKGKLKTITEHPLKYEELEQLYFAYKQLNKEAANNVQQSVYLAHQRNIIIVGLLIWQGLHSGELEKLESSHINLDEGKIYIPSTARSNSRELKLHPQQILALHTYIHGGIREKLIKRKSSPPSGVPEQSEGKERSSEGALFGARCYDIMQSLTEELKGINPIRLCCNGIS